MLQFVAIFLLAGNCIWYTVALDEPFDAFDRKLFKVRKHRFATYDKSGIMTLDGSLNGKSNDLTFPNLEYSELKQELCQPNPKLLFELCETQRLNAWTGLVLCYESKLAQPNIDPHFRIKPHDDYTEMVKAICGKRQNAIIIKREVHNFTHSEQDAQKNVNESECDRYKPLYSFRTTFAPEKPIFFEMPDRRTEKQCAILHFGGENIMDVNVTNLRREQMPMYKNFDRHNYSAGEWNNIFPDMANRQHRLSDNLGPWYLLLDFAPPFNTVQNVSVYGWMPMKIKITGHSIKSCTLGWQFLQSREVSGLKAKTMMLRYTLLTGRRIEETESKRNQREDIDFASEGETDQLELSASPDNMQGKGGGAMKNAETGKLEGGKTLGSKGIAKMQNRAANRRAGLSGGTTAEMSFKAAWGSTEGYQNSNGEYSGITAENWQHEQKVRRETVFFSDFEGDINIEQAVFNCFGFEFGVDRVRYRNITENPVIPDAVEVQNEGVEEQETTSDDQQQQQAQGEECMDYVAECHIWASKGECQSRRVFMLTRCKQSCGLCKKVRDNLKPKPGRLVEQKEEDGCYDEEAYSVDCALWAKMDECHKNPKFMNRNCRKSCQMCRSQLDQFMEDKEKAAHEDDY